jgi:multidrug resistance efflux pump
MSDYEWQIRMLEKDLAHAKEMQALARARMDAHDTSIAAVEGTLNRIGEKLDRTAALQQETAETVKVLAGSLERLIAALAPGGNGHT